MPKLTIQSSKHKNALFLAHACDASYADNPAATSAFAKLKIDAPPVPLGEEIGATGFVAASGKNILVVIRGTDDVVDWIDSLDTFKVKAFGGRVHSGFRAVANSIYAEMKAAIESEEHAARTRVILAGHSQGAAAAIILAAKLRQNGYPKPLQVYGFGCPRIGDLDFFDSYEPLRSNTHLYINRADVVPMFPLMSQDFVHAANQHLLRDGGLSTIDLDVSSDTAKHILRVPNTRDHQIRQGYVEGLKSFTSS